MAVTRNCLSKSVAPNDLGESAGFHRLEARSNDKSTVIRGRGGEIGIRAGLLFDSGIISLLARCPAFMPCCPCVICGGSSRGNSSGLDRVVGSVVVVLGGVVCLPTPPHRSIHLSVRWSVIVCRISENDSSVTAQLRTSCVAYRRTTTMMAPNTG